MPCEPVTFDPPSGPSGPAIPGFGVPFAFKLPSNLFPFPDGFPEDLLELFNRLKMLLPPGSLKPALNPNFGKDVFDAIMKLMDQFLPFLMLYKFFLPILKLILCILEVLCAINNPIKLINALKRLFRDCIPEFLNLFPIFALILMIYSLILLLIALIKYILEQLLKLIKLILRNIIALGNAFATADEESILAIAVKIGNILCFFQNLFVLLSIFALIIQIFKDILSNLFAIPPCQDGADSSSECCGPDVCPQIVKEQFTLTNGSLQYFNQVDLDTGVVLPAPYNSLTTTIRPQSYQLYDFQQPLGRRFIDITDGYDVPEPKSVFFPTDSTYTSKTSPKQAAYTIDLKLFYDPKNWGREGDDYGKPRYIVFKDCILLTAPTTDLEESDQSTTQVQTGIARLAGGAGYEEDGTTRLKGFKSDGITKSSDNATLENFIFLEKSTITNPNSHTSDGYKFVDVEYTFKPNSYVLYNKTIITAACEPSLNQDKNFTNIVYGGDIATKLGDLTTLLNSDGTVTQGGFPNPATTQECLTNALDTLRLNLTESGVADFQSTCEICLNTLNDECNEALKSIVGIGFDQYKSSFSVEPTLQFTTRPIKVKVDLKEVNSTSIASDLPTDVAATIANRISPKISFGEISNFTYDGYQYFEADITSTSSGSGDIQVSFDGKVLSTITVPSDITVASSVASKVLNYQFVFTPSSSIGSKAPHGDVTEGAPRRDGSADGSNKDNV